MEDMVLIERVGEGSHPRIVGIVPAYNEERFIASVVITALQYVERVIVVDDGSSDRTALVARIAGADVVQLPGNCGKGSALNAGCERARQFDPDVIVMLDADSQHDPAEIPRIAQPILDGDADVVVGSRFLGTRSAIPPWRRVGQRALTLLTNSASGVSITDSQSGFRAFTLDALEAMRFRTGGLAMESEMQFLLERSALRVREVPISVQYLDGNKRNPVLHGLRVVEAILTLVARRRPLLFLGLPGLGLMILGFLLGVSVIHVINHRHAVPTGTTVLSSMLIMLGLVLVVTAVILNTLEHFMVRLQQELRDSLRQVSDVVRRKRP